MNAHPSPLKCTCYFVTDLVVTANPEHDPKKPPSLDFRDLLVDCRTEKPKKSEGEKEQQLWRISLRVAQNVDPEKNSPYNFTVSILGQFVVHPEYPKEKTEQLVTINGSSLLYTTVREILRSAMSHGPFPPLILPTVCFMETKGETCAVEGRGRSAIEKEEDTKR